MNESIALQYKYISRLSDISESHFNQKVKAEDTPSEKHLIAGKVRCYVVVLVSNS